MIPVLVGDQSAGKQPCPLGCGNNWHGLPKEPTHRTTACPSIYGIPVPVGESTEEEANVA